MSTEQQTKKKSSPMTATKILLKGLIREEFIKRLLSEADEKPAKKKAKAHGKFSKKKYTYSDIKPEEMAAFGKWMRTNFSNKIPKFIPDEKVAALLIKNFNEPGANGEETEAVVNPYVGKMNPNDLFDMFKMKTDLQKTLGSKEGDVKGSLTDKDLGATDPDEDGSDLPDETGKGKRVARGGEGISAEKVAKELGTTHQNIKNIEDRASEKYKRFYDEANPEDMEDDDYSDLFGDEGKFESTVEKAADMYVKLLSSAIDKENREMVSMAKREQDTENTYGAINTIFDDLISAGVLKSADLELTTTEEYTAVQVLLDLVEEGKTEEAKRLLKKDLDQPLHGSNIIKSFQTLVAKLMKKAHQDEDVALGIKKPVGRPKL